MQTIPDMRSERSLDHFVVSVRDLTRAEACYRRLGFHVLPRMQHIDIGSSNHVIQFETSYIELVGELEQSLPALRERMMPRFAAGEGLSIVSLSSDDLEGDHTAMSQSGLTPAPIINARRKITMPDGSEHETDSSCFYVWRDGREYLSLFYSHHGRPRTIFTPEYYSAHSNGALGVDQLVLVSDEVSADREAFVTYFGAAPVCDEQERLVFFGARGDVTELLSPRVARSRFPELDLADPLPLAGFPVALRVRVRSLERLRAMLEREQVALRADMHSIVVPPSEANGVVLVFAEGEVGNVTS